MPNLLIILCLGVCGGLLARRLKLPGGSLIGAVLASGGYSLIAGSHPLPTWVRSAAMILVGISLGAALSREALWKARKALPLALVLLVAFSVLSLVLGVGLHRFAPSNMAIATTVLGCMPGGASCTMAMATDFGADMNVVAALALVRQILIVSLLPVALQLLMRISKRPSRDLAEK